VNGIEKGRAVTWKRVRVELARSPDHPDGSNRHGYEFNLPLTEDGRIDRALYDEAPELCTVHRFWEDGDDSVGQIVRSGRGRWVFSYDPGEGDDEAIPRFTDHVFREGEYLAVRERDGPEHTFRIVLVEDAPGIAHVRPR
jgi:hypothetical protein